MFFVFCFTFPLFAQGPVKINIAVNELAGKGIDHSTAEICSDRLRNEMVSTGVFRVMERGEMQNILKEQGFQQSGACDDKACMVEVGQLLGVERMVAGSIGKVGDFHTILLRVVDVRTSEIIIVVNEDFTGSVQDLISQAIGKAAGKLAQLSKEKTNISSIESPATDSVETKIVPDNTTIETDNKPVSGVLEIRSSPAGASIFLNGEQAGVTNWQNAQQEPGSYSLKISKDSFTTIDDSLFVLAGDTIVKMYDLQKTVTTASQLSSLKENTGSGKKFRGLRRITFSVLSLAGAGIGYAFERKSNNAYDTYSSTRVYNQPLHDNNWGDVVSAVIIRNICYGLSAASAAGFLISIPF